MMLSIWTLHAKQRRITAQFYVIYLKDESNGIDGAI